MTKAKKATLISALMALTAAITTLVNQQVAPEPEAPLPVDTTFVPFLGEEVPTEDLQERVFITDVSFKDFGAVSARKTFAVKGQGVEVCVIDTGADPTHEQLDSRLVAFKDFVGTKTNAYDDNGHGTHVASIVLGDGKGEKPAGKYKGVAPAATLSVAKVLSATGGGSVEQVISGIAWCANRPSVDVINLSLSTAVPTPTLDAAANQAVALGKVVVVSAGNSGPVPGFMGSPALATNAITVGAASEWSSKPGRPEAGAGPGPYLAPFSSRGPTTAPIKPDITAPGVTVMAAAAGGGYRALSGTSMASPFVAGVAALMLDAKPALTPDAVKSLLMQTALDLGKPGKDRDYGAGYINGHSAVAAALGQPGKDIFPPHVTFTATVGSGRTYARWLNVTDGAKPVVATIIYENTNSADPNDQLGWPHYDATIYSVNSQGAVDTAMCPNIESFSIPFCGAGASGRQQTLAGFPKSLITGSAPGNHVLSIFPDTVGTPHETRAATFTVDLFFVGTVQ